MKLKKLNDDKRGGIRASILCLYIRIFSVSYFTYFIDKLTKGVWVNEDALYMYGLCYKLTPVT